MLVLVSLELFDTNYYTDYVFTNAMQLNTTKKVRYIDAIDSIAPRHVADVHFINVHCYNESDDHRASNLFLDAGEIDLAGLHYHQK